MTPESGVIWLLGPDPAAGGARQNSSGSAGRSAGRAPADVDVVDAHHDFVVVAL